MPPKSKLPPAMRRAFRGKESPSEEATERKLATSAGKYKAAERKFEGEAPKFACGGAAKTRKFARGGAAASGAIATGDVEEDMPSGASDEASASDETPVAQSLPVESRAVESTPLRKQSFAEAFRAAKDGETFMWNGKPYAKKYADQPKAAPAPAAKPAAPAPAAKPVTTPAPKGDATQALGAHYAAMDRRVRELPPGTSPAAREALIKLRDDARASYEKSAAPKPKEEPPKPKPVEAPPAPRPRTMRGGHGDQLVPRARMYAGGGVVKCRGDGCAARGRTKGTMR